MIRILAAAFVAALLSCALSSHARADYTLATIGMDRTVTTATPVCIMSGPTCKIQLGIANLDTGGWSLPGSVILPVPSPTQLGGVFSATAPANQFQTGINTTGTPTFAQPTIANIAPIAPNSILGNATGSNAAPQALTAIPNNITATTAAPGDNSQLIATTAYVVANSDIVVPNNAALSARATTSATAITRLGYATLGDSSPLVYKPSGLACSLNAGAGDGFSQVPSGDGKCWLAQLPITAWDARWAGVDPTGSTPSNAKIQALIDALPPLGGHIEFPCGFFNLADTITIGNGNSTTVSTRSGVYLSSSGGTFTSIAPATTLPCTQFTWVGPADGRPAIHIAGPLNGWGLNKILLYGNDAGDTGIKVDSASDGIINQVSILKFYGAGIWSTAYPSSNFGGAVYNSGNNLWTGVTVSTSDNEGAKGLFLDGAPDGITSTSVNTFTNLTVHLNTTGANHGTGIYLRITDSSLFVAPHVFGAYSTVSSGIFFDYAAHPLYPSGNVFSAVGSSKNVGTLGQQWAYSGAPGDNLVANTIVTIGGTDESQYPNTIPKIDIGLPQKTAPDVALLAQPATPTGANIVKPYISGLYRVCHYMVVRTAGTAGSINLSLAWNDGVAQSAQVNTVGVTAANTAVDGCKTIYNVATWNIAYSVNVTGITGSPTYDLRITTERLN